MEGWNPKFPIQYLAKIAVFRSDYPNINVRHLPSASVHFHGLPFPHVLCKLDNML